MEVYWVNIFHLYPFNIIITSMPRSPSGLYPLGLPTEMCAVHIAAIYVTCLPPPPCLVSHRAD
jgi:hypothetical protein